MRDFNAYVTPAGADWLASASAFPRSVHALWSARPGAPSVLPCGTAFDVVSVTPLFGRRALERLRSDGPGTGPVALHRDRMLLFAAPGTARRLPALLRWHEWRGSGGYGGAWRIPPIACHGLGDVVTVPPLRPGGDCPATTRWLVAPEVRRPWLPEAQTLLWACVRAVRTGRVGRMGRMGGDGAAGTSISGPARQDAKVYHVGRR